MWFTTCNPIFPPKKCSAAAGIKWAAAQLQSSATAWLLSKAMLWIAMQWNAIPCSAS